MNIIHISGDKAGQPLSVGDKVPGGRMEKYYATVEEIHDTHVRICYNGEVRSVTILPRDYERVLGAKIV